ncbi:MAG: Ada metal-binding domain-containing protein [Patescibacteria group bacterium]
MGIIVTPVLAPAAAASRHFQADHGDGTGSIYTPSALAAPVGQPRDAHLASRFPRSNPVDNPRRTWYDRPMTLTVETMRARFYARDAAYDGRFLAGVLTTGVYCLPSCRARRPREENVRFFRTPAEAETAGLRPCRRCRPDDYYLGRDPDREALVRLAARVREAPDLFPGVGAVAQNLAAGTTRLNELFYRHYHRSAGRFLAEARVDKARRLLVETRDTVADVAAASGYESLSSFNANFRRLTGLCPGDYRSLPAGRSFTLACPGRWAVDSLRLQGRDPGSLCERFTGSNLSKGVTIGEEPAMLEMTARNDAVHCRIAAPDPARIDMFAVHAVALRLLGFSPDPAPFERAAKRDARLGPLVGRRPGLRIPQTATAFEGLTWAIVGQQISLPFAFELRRRLVRLAGRPAGGDLYAHPAPADVAALDYADLVRLQFSRRKAEYLIDAARAIAGGGLAIESLGEKTADALLDTLRGLRGIGIWSANYLGMRAYAFADCAPLGDTGLAAGLQRLFGLAERPDVGQAERLLGNFRPFRSFVTFHLWQDLGGGA